MISVVNGYVCQSSCDAAKAKKGENPNTPPGQLQPAGKKDDPAVIFGGALKAIAAGSSSNAASANVTPTVDLFA